MKALKHKRALRSLAIGIGTACVLGSLLLATRAGALDALDRIEKSTLDPRLRIAVGKGTRPPDVVIVTVDQASLEDLSKSRAYGWPWPRDTYAAIIEFCAAAGARAIGFDFLFTEGSVYSKDFGDDDTFADATKAAGKVYHGFTLHHVSDGKPQPPPPGLERHAVRLAGAPPPGIASYHKATVPISPLLEAAHGLGCLRFNPDSDGVARRAELLFAHGDRLYPSLALALAMEATGTGEITTEGERLSLGGREVLLDREGRHGIWYYGPSGAVPAYSAAFVIGAEYRQKQGQELTPDQQRFRERIANKIVIVGATAPGLFDSKATPFSEVYPGVEIAATVVQNLLSGDSLRRVPAGLSAGLLALLAVAGALVAGLSSRGWIGAVLLAAIGGAYATSTVAALSRSHLWLDLVLPLTGLATGYTGSVLAAYLAEGRQRRFITDAFSRYLHPKVIEELVSDPAKLALGGQRRTITVFFSDLAGFTSFSERFEPEQLVPLLNDYLTRMTEIVLKLEGTVDKYEGDAIMAFWGAPIEQRTQAALACRAALEQQRALATLREELKARGLPELDARMGLNTGPALVGNLGSKEKFDYTAIGDTVNLGSRLEGANKAYGTRILAAEETVREAGNEFLFREMDVLRVKGKKQPIRVYEVVALAAEASEATRRGVARFEAGLALYRSRRFDEAGVAFREVVASLGSDPPSTEYLRRCAYFSEHPPTSDWDGVFTMTTK